MHPTRPLLWGLLAFLGGAAACSGGGGDDDAGGPGSFVVTVDCAAPACGLSGLLKLQVREESCDAPLLITITLPGVTTTAGDPVVESLLLEQKTYCVETWLDVNGNGVLSSGDAFASDGPQTDEAGDDTPLDFVLDSIEP